MILQRHWSQSEPLSKLDESYFNDDLTHLMNDFIQSENYKNYYSNHLVLEVCKNIARLFNKNTEEYIAIGFFNTKDENKTV